jgi:hypothetical protein
MAHYFFLALNVFCVLLGVALIVVRLFLYESDQGRIESKIQDVWIRIDDLKPQVISRHVSFMRTMADLVGRGLDKIFGQPLLSIQMLVVSICYAIATALMSLQLLAFYGHQGVKVELLKLLLFYVVAGTFPVFARAVFKEQRTAIVIWLAVLGTLTYTEILSPLVALVQIIYSSEVAYLTSFIWALCGVILVSLLFYSTSIWLFRKSLRAIRDAESATRISILGLVNTLPIIALYVSTKIILFVIERTPTINQTSIDPTNKEAFARLWGQWGTKIDTTLVLLLVALYFFNSVFIISAVIFVLFSAFMLLHNAFWPVISRWFMRVKGTQLSERGEFFLSRESS